MSPVGHTGSQFLAPSDTLLFVFDGVVGWLDMKPEAIWKTDGQKHLEHKYANKNKKKREVTVRVFVLLFIVDLICREAGGSDCLILNGWKKKIIFLGGLYASRV